MNRLGCLLAGALVLAGCASAPVHYYTLVPSVSGAASVAGSFQFELTPVAIPPQVDQPQLAVREGEQSIALLDGERWIAPLADEVRGALSVGLSRRLGVEDAAGLPLGNLPRVRIKVDMRRFDSRPGGYVLDEAVWTLHLLRSGVALTCVTRLHRPVGADYSALVTGHQQALAALAAKVALVVPAVADGRVPACPGD